MSPYGHQHCTHVHVNDHNMYTWCDINTSDGGSVGSHRAIVAAVSPVFHAMLYGNMKECREKENKLSLV